MLRTQSVRFTYESSQPLIFPDIQLERGQSLLILGNSGVGKTTLIQILAGLLSPLSGTIELNGLQLHKMTAKELDQYRGQHIGMVFQRPHFVRNLSILDNLLLSLFLSKKKSNKTQAIELLSKVGLGDKVNKLPDQLSEGEQQRASIALAVVKKPSLILADEPTASLDDVNCEAITTLLKEQAASTNAQLIIITHDHRLKRQFNNTITL